MQIQFIANESVSAARHLIESAQRIVTISHMSPDGDAVGSSLAARHLLRALGKQVTTVLPNHFPAFFGWMNGASDILIYENDNKAVQTAIVEADLVILLDLNSLKRINGVKPLVEQSKAPKLLIDHHLDPEQFTDVIVSYPNISSTSELLYALIVQMGWGDRIDKACAEAIYVGMMTDTGNFSYTSQQPEIYAIISELLKIGIDKDDIYRRVYTNYSEKRMRLMGYCLLNKMKIYPKQHTAVISLTKEELERFDFHVGDTEGFVNIPLSIDGINRSVFVREEEKKVKLSFRSQGAVPVNTIAAQHFGGGGHLNAAGGESYLSIAQTLTKLEFIILNLQD
ncbi:MAG: bifunctional oligoribonuclease/PAP phosphatase NrnA [Paludibacteraceae bacterium]|nr:bifunctional oligoribonuclease/PAP phosphatase NrnA [Paludibacteraceae bacterium]